MGKSKPHIKRRKSKPHYNRGSRPLIELVDYAEYCRIKFGNKKKGNSNAS